MEVIKLNENAHLDIYYNHSDTVILVIEGGAYEHLSYREATPVAKKFFSLNYDTAILYYSVNKFPRFAPLNEGNKAIEILKEKYKNIILIGFSAGGHLAGLLATDIYAKNIKGMILAYPVITFGEETHLKSRELFLQGEITKENIEKYSIEKRVNSNTCPTFIWTLKNDLIVPIKNTLLMIEALKNNNVYYESIIFETGKHGVALADSSTILEDNDQSYVDENVAKWVDVANNFILKVIKNAKDD